MQLHSNAFRLRITGPDGTTQESVADSESLILGSGIAAGVQIPDPGVSHCHVLLRCEKDGAVTATDLDSKGGTRLGERPLVNTVALRPGDVLRIGASRVEVLFGNAALRGHGAVATGKPWPRQETFFPAAVGSAALKRRPIAAPVLAPAPPIAPSVPPSARGKVLQVAMVWGDQILAVQHYRLGAPVAIGDSPGNAFQLSSNLVGRRFVLARGTEEGLVLRVPAEASLTVWSKTGKQGLADLVREGRAKTGQYVSVVQLRGDERAKVSIDNVSFLARFVAPSPAVPLRDMARHDASFFGIVALCLILGAVFIASSAIWRRSDLQTSDDIQRSNAQVVKLLIHQQARVLADPALKHAPKPEKEGAKAADEEGKFGKPEVKQKEAAPAKPGSPIVDKNKSERDRRKVMATGLLGAIGKNRISNVFGPGGLGTGINNALGGLRAEAPVGDQHGVGGLGSRGTGVGGGGTGLGLGGSGVRGDGPGGGGHGIDLSARGHETTRIVPGRTTVVGGLSKEVIAKVIRSHQSEIKYCYEAELQKEPELSGKVAMLFVINGDGSVSEANVSETSLNNNSAEQCMVTRIKRWKFPEPQGGGIVTVTFPWIFKPAGA